MAASPSVPQKLVIDSDSWLRGDLSGSQGKAMFSSIASSGTFTYCTTGFSHVLEPGTCPTWNYEQRTQIAISVSFTLNKALY